MKTWAAQLSEYDASGYDDDSLFKLFARKYTTAIDKRVRAYDHIIKEVECGELNWDKLVQSQLIKWTLMTLS